MKMSYVVVCGIVVSSATLSIMAPAQPEGTSFPLDIQDGSSLRWVFCGADLSAGGPEDRPNEGWQELPRVIPSLR